ncbi:MAG: YHYH protein [Bacteroidota bacterium]
MKRLTLLVAVCLAPMLLMNCGDDEAPDNQFMAVVTVTASDATATEGADNASFTIQLDRTNDSGTNLTISYSLTGTATSGDDFTALTGSVSIPNGQNSATIDVMVIDDSEDEIDETVILTLSSTLPTGVSLGGSSNATVTIIDNDDPDTGFTAVVTVTAPDASATEGSDDGRFSVRLDQSNSSGAGINISYAVSGSATSGSDFTALSGTVTIPNGQSAAPVDVAVIDDDDIESDETVILTLSSTLPTGITLGTETSATVTISDNDAIANCPNDNSIDMDNFNCNETPSVANQYMESVSSGTRTVTTNGIPNHDFRNQIPMMVNDLNSETRVFNMDATPSLASNATELTNNGMPAWRFGVATNGVPIDPAPAQPFIFTNPTTMEFNFDWVFEPNYNMNAVGLDCAIAHVQPDGTYHYHGDMAVYADIVQAGVGSGTTTPTEPVQIGWAADGFPILYKYGPDANGTFGLLESSYRIRSGQRPGDGESEPCGEYNGKYTNDFEFVNGLGDLDECNGISQSVTLGGETFSYFYVITAEFPIIPRCISGAPNNSFRLMP